MTVSQTQLAGMQEKLSGVVETVVEVRRDLQYLAPQIQENRVALFGSATQPGVLQKMVSVEAILSRIERMLWQVPAVLVTLGGIAWAAVKLLIP